jgi:hypothetical protein
MLAIYESPVREFKYMVISSEELRVGLEICPDPKCAACEVARELLFLRNKFNGGQPATAAQMRPSGKEHEVMQTLVNEVASTVRGMMKHAGLKFRFTFLARDPKDDGKNIVISNDDLGVAADAVREAKELEQSKACRVVSETRPN